jgi:hypothetical protein
MIENASQSWRRWCIEVSMRRLHGLDCPVTHGGFHENSQDVCRWRGIMNPEDLSFELRLAAIVTLLSSSALKGVTVGKVSALLEHFEAAVQSVEQMPACHQHLASALKNALRGWQGVCCHPASVPHEAGFAQSASRCLH